jgi:hypothetical protein
VIWGTLLTKLNNYAIRVVISRLEALPQESVCLVKQDSMPLEPSTTLSSGELKSAGSWMAIREEGGDVVD